MVVHLPGERIVERYFQPVERQTEPLPVTPQVHIEVPATPPAAPHITVNVERNKDENNQSVPGETTSVGDTPRVEKERSSAPTPEVPPTAEVPRMVPPLEVGGSTEPEVKPGTSAPPELSAEEKSSSQKKKLPPKVPTSADTGSSGDKMKVYNGKGRRHTDDEIDDILDEYLQYGHLPKYVTERQRRDYRKHKRLELRRMYLEQAGLIKTL